MKYSVPVTRHTFSSRRPHLIERLYSFAGAAFPSDSGEGGTRGWYLCVCRDRVEVLPLHTPSVLDIEGRLKWLEEMLLCVKRL
jgi:hypothetical protein